MADRVTTAFILAILLLAMSHVPLAHPVAPKSLWSSGERSSSNVVMHVTTSKEAQEIVGDVQEGGLAYMKPAGDDAAAVRTKVVIFEGTEADDHLARSERKVDENAPAKLVGGAGVATIIRISPAEWKRRVRGLDGKEIWMMRVETRDVTARKKLAALLKTSSMIPWVVLEIGQGEPLNPTDGPRAVSEVEVRKTMEMVEMVEKAGYVCYHVWGKGECGDDGTRGSGRDCLWKLGTNWVPEESMKLEKYAENVEAREGKAELLCSLAKQD